MTAFLIILLVIIIAAAAYYGYKKGTMLRESGKLAIREGRFWEDAELLYTKTPFDELRKELMNADYSGSGVTAPRSDGEQPILIFQSAKGFNAAVAYMGEIDGEHKYNFSILNWKMRNGAVQGFLEMNVLMTVVEKVFLALDPDTEAQIEPRQIKTKTKLF